MASITLETAIISELRKRPLTIPKVAAAIGKHAHTVRPVIYDLVERRALSKGPIIDGYPTYVVGNYLQRHQPVLRTWGADIKNYIYVSMDAFLDFVGKRTKASEAVDNFPVIISKLLFIGFKYNTIKDQWILEGGTADELQTRLKPLRRDLRNLRMSFDDDYKALTRFLELFTQLDTNPDFWDLEQLGNNFNKQINYEGNLIPPIDSHKVVETNSNL